MELRADCYAARREMASAYTIGLAILLRARASDRHGSHAEVSASPNLTIGAVARVAGCVVLARHPELFDARRRFAGGGRLARAHHDNAGSGEQEGAGNEKSTIPSS